MTAYVFGLEEHSYFNSGGHKGDLYYYTLGGRLLGALDNTGKTTFDLSDALGSVLASFSSAAGIAAIKGNQVFGPYGNARDSQGTINTAKGFTGQYNDSLTGLDYYGSRYYDQVAGVFLSADIVQGNGSGMNPYAYVGGNPETFNDPTGHDPDPGSFLQFVKDNPWILVPMAMALSPTGLGAWLLIGTSIGIVVSPNRSQEPTPTNSPQPTGAPTPDETPTPTPTPSTDTNGAMCRTTNCYTWDSDTQLSLAKTLDAQATKARTQAINRWQQNRQGPNPMQANAGAGQLQILTNDGSQVFYGSISRLGYRGGPHSEEQIIQWSIGQIAREAQSVDLEGATINLLIFSQTAVCSTCLSMLNSSTWLDQLYQATGLSSDQVTINLSVWQRGNPAINQPPYIQIYPTAGGGTSYDGPRIGGPF